MVWEGGSKRLGEREGKVRSCVCVHEPMRGRVKDRVSYEMQY